MRMILRSLARNESTIVNNNTIIKDVNEDTNLASKNTVLDYINVLEKLYLIECCFKPELIFFPLLVLIIPV